MRFQCVACEGGNGQAGHDEEAEEGERTERAYDVIEVVTNELKGFGVGRGKIDGGKRGGRG